jgi:hypothetical protein
MNYYWDIEKNEKLKSERGVSFDEMLIAINNGYIIDIIEHPNNDKYPNQKLYIIKYNNYVYIVPIELTKSGLLMKTIFKSRKFNKIYNNSED